MFISLPMTVSRTAIIGLVVVLAVLMPSWPRRRRRPAYVMAVVGAAAVRVLVPGLLGTILVLFSSASGNSDNSSQARTKDYAGVTPYIKERLWFGRGPATFIPSLYRYTDNYYLLALVEVGVVGVTAVLIVYITGIRAGRLGRRLSVDEAFRDLGQCFAATFAVMLRHQRHLRHAQLPHAQRLVLPALRLLGCVFRHRALRAAARAQAGAA